MKFDTRSIRIIMVVCMLFTAWNVGMFGQDTAAPVAPVAPPTSPSDVVTDQPATPTTEVPSPAAPQHATDQAMWALVASYFLQWLKRTKWFPWLTDTTAAKAQAAWGFALALLTAVGINVAVNGSIFDAGGMAISFTNITWQAFKDVVWQWTAQQGWYDFIVKKTSLPVGGSSSFPEPV